MKDIQKILLTGAFAAAFTLGMAATADNAHAGGYGATTTTKTKTIEQSTYTVGTRRVGLVGSRPYPLVISHVDSSTVKTNTDGTVVQYNCSATTKTTSEPFAYTSGGGTYYTSEGGKYYGGENLNITVRNTGSFND